MLKGKNISILPDSSFILRKGVFKKLDSDEILKCTYMFKTLQTYLVTSQICSKYLRCKSVSPTENPSLNIRAGLIFTHGYNERSKLIKLTSLYILTHFV